MKINTLSYTPWEIFRIDFFSHMSFSSNQFLGELNFPNCIENNLMNTENTNKLLWYIKKTCNLDFLPGINSHLHFPWVRTCKFSSSAVGTYWCYANSRAAGFFTLLVVKYALSSFCYHWNILLPTACRCGTILNCMQ